MEDVRGKLRTLTQGQKSENVINQMSATFRALCDLADWTETSTSAPPEPPPPPPTLSSDIELGESSDTDESSLPRGEIKRDMELHYNIQLILPESRDPKVYDALFASLRKHLL